MALGSLFILFIVIAVISILGTAFLFLAKQPKVKTTLLYTMAVFGMIVAYLGATALPTNFIVGQIVYWAVGALGIIALLVHHFGKSELLAKLLVTVSVVGGVINLFFF